MTAPSHFPAGSNSDRVALPPQAPAYFKASLHTALGGTFITCNSFSEKSAERALEGGTGDLGTLGRAWLVDPDLTDSLRAGQPLCPSNPAMLRTFGARGSTDYPHVRPQTERRDDPALVA